MFKSILAASVIVLFSGSAYATCATASNTSTTTQRGYVNTQTTTQDGGCITFFNKNKSTVSQITPDFGVGSNYSKTTQKNAFFQQASTEQLGGDNESTTTQENGVINEANTVQGP